MAKQTQQRKLPSPHMRRGATTVEFAMVVPIAFALLFGLLELSTWYQVIGTSTSAILKGGREASIRTASRADVDKEINKTLNIIGISQAEITIVPAELDASVERIQLRLEIPATAANGFYLSDLLAGGSVVREIQVDRF